MMIRHEQLLLSSQPQPQPSFELKIEERPQPEPLLLLKSKSKMIIKTMLLQPLLLLRPHVQPHPPPQFVAAKSLI